MERLIVSHLTFLDLWWHLNLHFSPSNFRNNLKFDINFVKTFYKRIVMTLNLFVLYFLNHHLRYETQFQPCQLVTLQILLRFYNFPLPMYGRERTVLKYFFFRNEDFDGFTRFEVSCIRKITVFALGLSICVSYLYN